MSSLSSSCDEETSRVRVRLMQPPHDVEAAKASPHILENAVLRVVDAKYDGTVMQASYRKFNLGNDIAEGLKSLPPHKSHTARIFDVTIHSDFIITGLRYTKGPEKTRQVRDGLMDFLNTSYGHRFEERRIFKWLNDPLLVNDIGSISAQWDQQMGGSNAYFYRLVNRTSLQENPLDYDLYPRDSHLTCAKDEQNRLIAIIVNDVSSTQAFPKSKARDDHIRFDNPRSISHIYSGKSWTSLSNGSLDNFAKLLILDFFQASIYLQPVDYYAGLIYPDIPDEEIVHFSLPKNPHLQVPLGLFEPRLSAKSREAFKEIEDTEGILRSVGNLVDSIKFVIDALKFDSSADTWHPNLQKRVRELERLCEERGENAKRALEALNRQLDYLTKKHAIREAKSIRTLTILASFYLPLSLSASLLGMSGPFKGLAHNKTSDEKADEERLVGTNLLFDFFGIFIGLATATVFIIYIIQCMLWLKTHGLEQMGKSFLGRLPAMRSLTGPFSIWSYGDRWRFGGIGGRSFEFSRWLTSVWISAGFGVTLVTIFLRGMLGTAQGTWDISRYMFAGYAGMSLLLLVITIVIYVCLDRRLRM